MKLLPLASTLACILSANVLANSQPFTVQFFADEANKNAFIMSSNMKCHGPLSSERNTVKLRFNAAGDPTNIFPTEEACLTAGGTLTQEQSTKKVLATIAEVEKQKEKKEEEKKAETKDKEFLGINWGLGLAYTYTSDPLIHEISIASGGENQPGKILVDRQTKHRAIAMLESHYFFKRSWFKDCKIRGEDGPGLAPCDTSYGHGPFIAIGLAGEDGVDPLSTYGIGWMWGFQLEEATSWNIGVGLFVDTKAKGLRPGFADGDETMLSNIDELTYERDETGWMLMFSSTF